MSQNFLSLFSDTRKIRKHQKKVQILMLILLFMFLCAFCEHKYMKYSVFMPHTSIEGSMYYFILNEFFLPSFLARLILNSLFSFLSHYISLFVWIFQSEFFFFELYWIDCQHLFIDACLLINKEIPMQLSIYEWIDIFLMLEFSTSSMAW
jgi:hypothetical protein